MFAAAGHQNYAKSTRLYVQLMNQLPVQHPRLYNNISAVRLSKNPEFHKRSKHTDTRYLWIHERLMNGDLHITDILTKPVLKSRLQSSVTPRNRRTQENIGGESDGSKEQISLLITTRADGKVMKSCIVYSHKRAVPKAITDAVPAGFCIARSDSGWMMSEVFYEYLAITFIPT